MNPYPYFKACDIYVQTSRHEGWGLTITEAKAFYKPIVVTNFAGAKEQLKDGIDGDIAEITVSSIYEKLVRLFNEPHRRKKYTTSLLEQIYLTNIDYLSIFKE